MQNEDAGQRLLYDRFVAAMARLCLRYIADPEDAKEVLIDGFLRVFKMLKKFEDRGINSLEAWIRKIMINQCLMHLRKKRRVLFVDVSHQHIETDLRADVSVSAEEIERIIEALPEGYRTVFNLYMDGYSHGEISDLLGITESASRSQLAHARTRLREMLDKQGWK